MNKQTEALKMAIEGYEECLENLQGWAAYASEYFQDKWDLEGEVKDHKDKINACKEALEQPAQEPVAWINKAELAGIASYKAQGLKGWETNLGILKPEPDDIPLYTHPAPQPAQEPVAWTNTDELEELKNDMTTCYMYKTPYGDEKDVALYTHPHQWQGLTDDEIWELVSEIDVAGEIESLLADFGRMIEQALKEKNHG